MGWQNTIILIFFPIFLCVPIAEGANWKLLAKNTPLEAGTYGDAYYDEDSISYPYQTKGLFGMKSDKSYVGVWIKYVFGSSGSLNREMKLLQIISCKQKTITTNSIIFDGQYDYSSPFIDKTFGIEPDTTDEILYKNVCR